MEFIFYDEFNTIEAKYGEKNQLVLVARSVSFFLSFRLYTCP